jgi:hypothetical protein
MASWKASALGVIALSPAGGTLAPDDGAIAPMAKAASASAMGATNGARRRNINTMLI